MPGPPSIESIASLFPRGCVLPASSVLHRMWRTAQASGPATHDLKKMQAASNLGRSVPGPVINESS